MGQLCAKNSSQPKKYSQQIKNQLDLHSGVVFQNYGDLLLSNSYVIMPIRFDFLGLVIDIGRVLHTIDRTVDNIRVVSDKDEYFFDMMNDLKVFQMELRTKVLYISDFMTGLNTGKTSRTKRGMLDVVGSMASALFGVATEDQIDSLNDILLNIGTLTDENARNLNILDRFAELTTDHIEKLRHAQAKTIKSISMILNQTNALTKLAKNVEHRQLIGHSFSKLTANVLELGEASDQLIDGLRNMFSGNLDNRIIDNSYFSKVLEEIERWGHHLLASHKNKLLSTYRQLTTVTGVFDEEKDEIQFFLAIPVTNTISIPKLTLFKVDAFPVPVKK